MEDFHLMPKVNFYASKKRQGARGLYGRIAAPLVFRWNIQKLKFPQGQRFFKRSTLPKTFQEVEKSGFALVKPISAVDYSKQQDQVYTIINDKTGNQAGERKVVQEKRSVPPPALALTKPVTASGLPIMIPQPPTQYKVPAVKKRKMENLTSGGNKRPNEEPEKFEAPGGPSKPKKLKEDSDDTTSDSLRQEYAELAAYQCGAAYGWAKIHASLWNLKPTGSESEDRLKSFKLCQEMVENAVQRQMTNSMINFKKAVGKLDRQTSQDQEQNENGQQMTERDQATAVANGSGLNRADNAA